MKSFRRSGLFMLLISIGICGHVSAAGQAGHHRRKRAFHQKNSPEPVITDSSSEAAWRKKLPWIYRDTTLAIYRETLLRPLFKGQKLAPGNLSKRGGFLEIMFPRGRPLHEYAYAVESLCVATGIHVVEGHEFDPPDEHIEYRVQADSAVPLVLHLSLGKTVLAGSSRLAIVVVSLDSVGSETARRLLAFPVPLTLTVAAGDSSPLSIQWAHPPAGKDLLLELPMEPSNYPYVKPGPGALFIHHTRSELEHLLQSRLNICPAAVGFATTYGDRAIQNRPLLENVFRFTVSHSLVFLDLTASPRSLTAPVALQSGAVAFSTRIQEPDSGQGFEAELLRRCDRAAKTGEGIWVLRYFPALPGLLERLLIKNQQNFDQMGLEWVPLSGLRREKITGSAHL